MKLGFSVNAFSNYTLLDAIEKISKTGYDGVEIVLDIPHVFLPITMQKITQIKQSLIVNNVNVTNLNSNTVLGWSKNFSGEKFEPSLSNTNEKFRKWRLEYTKQSIDLAENLNCKSISITSGIQDLKNSQLCLDLFYDSLIQISEYAEKKNILIGIEYEPGLLIDNSDKVWHLISKDFAGEKFEPSLSNINQKFRKWRLEYTKQSIDIAEYLNSKSISITSGLNDLNNSDLCLNLFHNSLIEIAEYAEKKNISIAIEYEPGLLIDNSDKVWHLISKDFKNIGLNLDTCHAAVNQENLSDIIQKFGKKIIHTHISDCKNNIHYHLLPGEGKIDFKKLYDSLNYIGYSGFLTAELYTYYQSPEDAASKAFNYLKNLIK